MTPKENIRAFVERMPEDVTMEQVLYKLDLFVGVQTGLQQVERGEVIDHDEFMAELEKRYGEEEAGLELSSERRTSGNRGLHSQRLTKKRAGLHKTTKNSRKKT